jgi:hypothetical protein
MTSDVHELHTTSISVDAMDVRPGGGLPPQTAGYSDKQLSANMLDSGVASFA